MSSLKVYSIGGQAIFGINEFPSPHRVEDRLENEARIVHVVRGHSRLYAANKWLELESGDTVIMRPDNFVNNWLENDDGLNKVIVFQISTNFLAMLFENEPPNWLLPTEDQAPSLVKTERHELIATFYANLLSYLEHFERVDEDYIKIKSAELLNLLIKTDTSGDIQDMMGCLFIRKNHEFQQVIQHHLYEDLSVEELAFLCNMSISSFKRKFKNTYGTSPKRYINTKRLEKAQHLLSTSELSVGEICFECGYNDLSYFSKTFKRQFGKLPSELRS